MRTTRETVPRYLDQVKKLADAKREAAETCFSIDTRQRGHLATGR